MAKKPTKRQGKIPVDPTTGRPLVVTYRVDAEIRKALRDKPTIADPRFLVDHMAPYYFEARKREAEQDAEQKDVSELERMYGLEDTR